MRVLVVDDEEIKRVSLVDDLRDAGFDVAGFPRGEPALEHLNVRHADVAIVDLKMPGLGGVDVLRAMRKASPETDVVMMTGYGTIESAVEAMQFGAVDYVTKPFSSDEMIVVLKRLKKQRRLQRDNEALRIAAADSFAGDGELIAASPAMANLLSQIGRVAESDTHVLLIGETGVGKDAIAKTIHAASRRSSRPFVKIACATFAEQLLESELFGRDRGAYTGADRAQPGRFELGHEGTVYLDDVDDISRTAQTRLLRVIEERVVERVGGTRVIPVDVRIIASTKRDLSELVDAGTFRSDLYFRLNVVSLHIAPLRERPGDIAPLVEHFCRREPQPCAARVAEETLAILHRYAWPGNVRELRNLVERWKLLKRCDTIVPADLPFEIAAPGRVSGEKSGAAAASFDEAVHALERRLLTGALERAGGNKSQAAELLALKPSTFRNKLAQHDLSGD